MSRPGVAVEAGVETEVGARADAEPLLRVEDLRVTFGAGGDAVHAVNGISYDVGAGRSLGIVGESGSGKTVGTKSILRLLGRGARMDGRIVFGGRNLLALPEREMRQVRGQRIGMVFQDPQTYLNPTLTIGRQIAEPILWHGLAGPRRARERAIELLDQVGIPSPRERFSQYPFEFSGGMLQRALVAMALACDPDVLIADEPITALDVIVQAQILLLLRRLKAKRGMSLILVTHDLAVAAQVTDEILVMYAGMVVERATAQRFLGQSRHPYTRGLIDCSPRLFGPVRRLMPIPGAPPSLKGPPGAGCPFAPRCALKIDRCTAERPKFVAIAEGHRVACWRWEAVV